MVLCVKFSESHYGSFFEDKGQGDEEIETFHTMIQGTWDNHL